jgi:hypothetical protein
MKRKSSLFGKFLFSLECTVKPKGKLPVVNGMCFRRDRVIKQDCVSINFLLLLQMGGAYSAHVGDEKCVQNFGWKE